MSNHQDIHVYIKFMFFKKATKIDKIFKSQIDGEDFVNFCGLLRKHVRVVKFVKCLRFTLNMLMHPCICGQ